MNQETITALNKVKEALEFYAQGNHVALLCGQTIRKNGLSWQLEAEKLRQAGFEMMNERYNGDEDYVETGIKAHNALEILNDLLYDSGLV